MPILWFGDPGADQVETAGGKAASLSRLTAAGLPVPPGFVVGADAYRSLLAETGLSEQIRQRLHGVPVSNIGRLEAAAAEVRDLIRRAPMPVHLEQSIAGAYGRLCSRRSDVPVAVRSSATAEDLADASFAGQQDTYLGIRGPGAVADRVRDCWASLFTARAIMYRTEKGFDHLDAAIAVVVQELVEAEKAGVMFTAHPVTRDRHAAVIEAVYGLGESLVSGVAVPDHYTVDKASGALLESFVPAKEEMLVHDPEGETREVPVPAHLREAPVLCPDELAALAEMGRRLEALFGHPQDVEWAFMGGKLYLLQSRPITTL